MADIQEVRDGSIPNLGGPVETVRQVISSDTVQVAIADAQLAVFTPVRNLASSGDRAVTVITAIRNLSVSGDRSLTATTAAHNIAIA